MKHLENYEYFNEELTNQISLGGSYIGRMFNSAKRYGESIFNRVFGGTRSGNLGFSIGKGSKSVNNGLSKLISKTQRLFNEDDIFDQALKTDKETRIFAKKINDIVSGGQMDDSKRKEIINLIDEHQFYIKNNKKSSLKDLKNVLMKYKLELIFEITKVRDFVNKSISLQSALHNPVTKNKLNRCVGEYNNSIDDLIKEINQNNLGLKYKNSLKKFKEALENSKK